MSYKEAFLSSCFLIHLLPIRSIGIFLSPKPLSDHLLRYILAFFEGCVALIRLHLLSEILVLVILGREGAEVTIERFLSSSYRMCLDARQCACCSSVEKFKPVKSSSTQTNYLSFSPTNWWTFEILHKSSSCNYNGIVGQGNYVFENLVEIDRLVSPTPDVIYRQIFKIVLNSLDFKKDVSTKILKV